MAYLNLGIVAHIDAGKTSLTERLLYATGTIPHLGTVDDGSTQTDSDEIERRRGITIRAAVASFALDDLHVNLVDTPGHTEFVAEVERSFAVLDGIILVISAVEGVQAHTRVLYRAAKAAGIPVLAFVNKVDRMGARPAEVLEEVTNSLSTTAVQLTRTLGEGTAEPVVESLLGPRDLAQPWEALALASETAFDRYLSGPQNARASFEAVLKDHMRSGLATPVATGSARTGAGIAELLGFLRLLIPDPPGDCGPESITGDAFSVDHDAKGVRRVLVRLRSGEFRAETKYLHVHGPDAGAEQARQVKVVEAVGLQPSGVAEAGNVVALRTRPPIGVTDRLGSAGVQAARPRYELPKPTVETMVRAHDGNHVELYRALEKIADRDPTIALRAVEGGRVAVWLFGNIQAEVLAETLDRDYGIGVSFSKPTPLYFERLTGTGTFQVPIGRSPFTAGLGLLLEPAEPGAGLIIDMTEARGRIPRAFSDAAAAAFETSFQQAYYGWPLLDARLTLTFAQYDNATSTGSDFRLLAPVVLQTAIRQARTVVLQPLIEFECDCPEKMVPPVLQALERLTGKISQAAPTLYKDRRWSITGLLPAHAVGQFSVELPNLTGGDGSWSYRPSGQRPLKTPVLRRRTDGNPAKLSEYMHYLSLL
ncbi:tetracycline resistance ribosomal protection protein Otr(A) [Kribbella koreensis]|uniref:Tetracycline resistance ribosomal protection protein Otr(A) n=1 Tax=Kribbella koreensis TaxID=57909 RepID=A0ABP4BUE1_9ACTN